MLRALTKQVSSTFASCELTFLDRQPIDVEKAMEQHRSYEACLTELGVDVISLRADPSFPDGVFVEDPARLCNFLARYTTEPSRRICAVATARNEGVYLLEWLAPP